MLPDPPAPPSASDPSIWKRYARRNLLALGAVLVVGAGAAVALAGGDDDARRDDDPGPAAETTDSFVASNESTDSTAVTESSVPESTEPASTAPESTSTTSTSTTTTTIDPADVAHAFPVDPVDGSSWTPEAHANYRATDIFAPTGCGTRLVAPVTGEVFEVVQNTWDESVDDPATRGGAAVSIVGDDGVRYYMAHFQAIDPAIVPGARVTAGDFLGEMGDTGRAGACHVHFGLSLPCPGGPDSEWWVRRGVIWPDEYLASWRDGGNLSPLPELQAWFAEYPDACESVENTPYPVG